MAGRIERVTPGRASEQALSAVIEQAKAADPLAPVTVVVPSSTVALSLRLRLADVGPLAGVDFIELSRLVEKIGAPHVGWPARDGPRSPLTAAAMLAAARAALAEDPGLLRPVADHPATAASLVATYRAVRAAGVSPLEVPASASARARDVAALIRTMRSRLEPGHYDLQDLIQLAASRLDAPAAAASALTAEIGTVVAYLPAPMAAPVPSLLSVTATRLTVVVLAGHTGDALADRGVDRFVDALMASGSFELNASEPGARPTAPAGFATLLDAPDEDEEARSAIRVLLAHAEGGGDLGRCVVTYPDLGGSDGVSGASGRVRRQLDEAGIPWSGPRREPLADRPHGLLLRSLVDLAMPVGQGEELDRGQVMCFLSSGPIAVGRGLTAGLSPLEPELPIGEWDRCSRQAGVVSGIDEWRTRLGALVERWRQQPHREASADRAGHLLDVVERLSALVGRAQSCVTWKELTAWCLSVLGDLLDPGEARDELEGAVEDLEPLDAVEPLAGLGAADRLEHFRQAMAVVLERPSGGTGRFGVGPTVGPLAAVAGCRSDLLVVLGCREGELPARRRDDPLLPRHERELFGVAEPESGEEHDRRQLVSLLTGSERAVAFYARIDVAAGRSRFRSRWLDGDLFVGHATEIPSFAGALGSVAAGALPAASAADCELALLSTADASLSFEDALAAVDGDYGRRLILERQRAAARTGLSRFGGYLGQPADQLWRDVHSATALESFATCPLQFFFSHLLNLRRLEAPERVPSIEARDRGSLVHGVLEEFFAPTDEREGAIPVFDAAAQQRLEAIAEKEFRRYEASGKTGKRVNWEVARDQILRDLRLFVAIEVKRSEAGGYVPQAVELCFGREDAPPLVIEAAGRQVKFGGQIDRIDRGRDGQVVVVDYKTGKADRFKDIAKDPLGRGGHLQLPLYAKAALEALHPETAAALAEDAGPPDDGTPPPVEERSAPVRAEYRFASAVSGFVIVPVQLTEELDAELRVVLSTLVETIDSGCFPPRPGELGWMNRYENCAICDFNTVCTTDRSEVWERASDDERMKPYVELVSGREEGRP